jgi:hypothetical protein
MKVKHIREAIVCSHPTKNPCPPGILQHILNTKGPLWNKIHAPFNLNLHPGLQKASISLIHRSFIEADKQ